MPQQRKNLILFIAFASFISLGVNDGLLGVAWPTMRQTFEVDLDAVGLLFLFGTIGFFSVSLLSGYLLERIDTGILLIMAVAFRLVGILIIGSTPWWPVVAIGALFSGMGGGTIDALLNNIMSLNFESRQMNWMHGFYGVGVTIGPLIMTWLLTNGLSWRFGYYVVAGYVLLILITYILTRSWWSVDVKTNNFDASEHSRPPLNRLFSMPIVWFSMLVFFAYTGVEVSVGQWTFPLFTEVRGISPKAAGYWVSIYWGSLTLGRFVIGSITSMNDRLILRLSTILSVVGIGMVWWNPSQVVSYAGLALFGFSLGPIFPTLMAITPRRIGSLSTYVIGFQAAAASLGGASLPSLAGVLADDIGLPIVASAHLIMAAVMFVFHEAIIISRRRAVKAKPIQT